MLNSTMTNIISVSLLLLTFGIIHSFPNDGSLVVSNEKENYNFPKKLTGRKLISPIIYNMSIFSRVSNRFARTEVISKVKNFEDTAKETVFHVILPEQAYISGFIMEIDGNYYTAYVKEKGEAKKIYEGAKAQGTAAAHVEMNPRDSSKFAVSVNIEPQSKATFYLIYEELLQMKNFYELVINIDPRQFVELLSAEVLIEESKPLKFVRVPSIRSGNEIKESTGDLDPKSNIVKFNDTQVSVRFSPDEQRQKELAKVLGTNEEDGLSCQFVVQYDVERAHDGGEILVKDGYFVHFFAPTDFIPLPKHVVFILDVSSSMSGEKFKQMQEAMIKILDELRDGDSFNIIIFSSIVVSFPIPVPSTVDLESYFSDYVGSSNYNPFPKPAEVNKDNINAAKVIIGKLRVFGSTNIYEALERGIDVVQKNYDGLNPERQPLIIFLTDGQPTVGITNTSKIETMITKKNIKKIPIFALSFGEGAYDEEYIAFMRSLSLNNGGFTRHIYEGADASLQLERFYEEISSPLLSNVTFKYADDVKYVTQTNYPIFFNGKEIVIAGQIDDGKIVNATVSGIGKDGVISLEPIYEKPVRSLERLWAYLTIRQLLDASGGNKDDNRSKEALKLALKYSFVTPVTSLVVVKPSGHSSIDTQRFGSPSEYLIGNGSRVQQLPMMLVLIVFITTAKYIMM